MEENSPNIGGVIEFLTELFKNGLGYSAISTARSALSTIIELEGRPVGEHRLVNRFMKGVFNLRPALPKNKVTWDPKILLDYLRTLAPVGNITLKQLSFKCAALTWLLSGQRGQSIHLISIRNLTVNENEIKIRFGDKLKTSRPGFHQSEIVIKAFHEDKNMCIVNVMKEYLNRTEVIRRSENQLFISFRRPFKAVSRETLSRWISIVMGNAGLDMKIFTPHSLRSASTSNAKRRKVPIQTILQTAGWKKDCTFRKHYDKDIKEFGEFSLAQQSKE